MADRCEAKVYRRDTYRRCGGRRHFKRHYAEGRCDRLESKLRDEKSAHEQTRRDLSMVEGGMARTAIKRVVSEAREAKLREALEKIAYSCGSYSDARDVARAALAPAAPEPRKTLCSICRQVHGMEIIHECE